MTAYSPRSCTRHDPVACPRRLPEGEAKRLSSFLQRYPSTSISATLGGICLHSQFLHSVKSGGILSSNSTVIRTLAVSDRSGFSVAGGTFDGVRIIGGLPKLAAALCTG